VICIVCIDGEASICCALFLIGMVMSGSYFSSQFRKVFLGELERWRVIPCIVGGSQQAWFCRDLD
jgi:hypothetical protein